VKYAKYFLVLPVIFASFCGCTKPSSENSPNNTEPMYGGNYKPDVPQSVENSQSASKLGWGYYYKGDYETAMKRFNQAWMFDRNNSEAYWGFGLVMGQRATPARAEYFFGESIKYLNHAVEINADNFRILTDLAHSHTLLGASLIENGNKEKANIEFTEARNILKKAESINNSYPLIYSGYSLVEFYSGNFQKAKIWFDKAKGLGYKEPAYEKDLMNKLSRK
jgi:tetratricopeptide (TPR) repeat protein